MDMEMSGVAAWSLFFVSTPPRSTASGLHSFGFFSFFYQIVLLLLLFPAV